MTRYLFTALFALSVASGACATAPYHSKVDTFAASADEFRLPADRWTYNDDAILITDAQKGKDFAPYKATVRRFERLTAPVWVEARSLPNALATPEERADVDVSRLHAKGINSSAYELNRSRSAARYIVSNPDGSITMFVWIRPAGKNRGLIRLETNAVTAEDRADLFDFAK